MMKSKHYIAASLFGAMALTSCTRHEATRPVDFDKPDVSLLQKIALAAIAKRVPTITHDRLKHEHAMYQIYRDHMFKQTNEMLSVEFGVEDSMQEVERDGETVFEVQSISVTIQPDGQIDKGGVSSNATRYLTADLNPMRTRGSIGSPVWGDPFYPVLLDTPLSKPDRGQIESIALRAIARFLPAIPTDDLEFDSLSYFHGHHSGSTGELSACSITFWQTSTIQERKTKTEVALSGQQVTVQIQPDGSVREKGVQRSPIGLTMNRQTIEDIERKRQNKTNGE
ncbi:MAG: hypothetical protein HQ523_04305 [Lentisphaerae bacterium]|nr:hypothetical protein [Lentisphaerota bacterium]